MSSKMKQPAATSGKQAFTLGRDAFGKISAVEGIRLTPAMKKRAADAVSNQLTADERRDAIKRSHRKT
jgi:hypothetical protein